MYREEVTFGRSITDDCRIAGPLAARLRDSRASLTLRWLERISARVAVPQNEVFPTQELLDHVPLLVEAMADYLERPTEEGPAADRVIAKAAELGRMRFEQGFSPYQILKEFEMLGAIVLSYLSRVADETTMECPPGEFLICAQRLHRSLALIQQATTARYLAMVETQASERDQRLRAVNDLLGGVLRERLEQTRATAAAFDASDPASWKAELHTQLTALGDLIEQVRGLAEIPPNARMQRNVPLEAALGEAIRNVRDAARQRGVEIVLMEPLPDIEVNAGAVELTVLVFLSTLLRHGMTRGSTRRIEIAALGGGAPGDGLVRISVRDVGAIVPEGIRRSMQTRAIVHESVSHESPPGVSLLVTREAIEAIGGHVALQVDETVPASEFLLELPSRRSTDNDRLNASS